MSEIHCPHCGQNHPEGAKFCPVTGKLLEVEISAPRCPSCGEAVEPGWVVCAYCGKPLQQERRCPHCGQKVDRSWAGCAYCGSILQPQAQSPFTKIVFDLRANVSRFRLDPSYWKWIVGGLVLIVIVIFWLSRNSSGFAQKPEHYGVYLKEGGRLVEITQQEGSPGRNTASVSVRTNDNQPVLLVWNPGLDFQNLYLVSEGGEGQEVFYSTTPKGDGMLELKPAASLQPDTYCLIQADPLGVQFFFPNWCFLISQ